MSYFPEETAADLAANYSRHRFALEIYNYSGAVNICENCGESCDRLTHVEEFGYRGCDECVETALAVFDARAELADQIAGRKPVKIERMQGELFPGVA